MAFEGTVRETVSSNARDLALSTKCLPCPSMQGRYRLPVQGPWVGA